MTTLANQSDHRQPWNRLAPSPAGAVSLERLLECACLDAAAKSGRTDIDLRITLLIEGVLADEDHPAVLAAMAVMVGNAIEHGFYGYSRGEIGVRLICGPFIDTGIEVTDNGWGFDTRTDDIPAGSGLRLLNALGEVSLTSEQIAPGYRLNKVRLLLSRLSGRSATADPQ